MPCQMTTTVALVILGCCIASATASYDHYRLPTSIQPDLYKLSIVTHLEDPANLTYYGEVSIRFKVLQDTTNITLHVRNLTIYHNSTILKSDSNETSTWCLKGFEIVPEHDYYIIQLCEPLLKDQSYQLTMHFSAFLNAEFQGYYRSSYVVKETNEMRWLSVTQFEPTFAREAFPCLDEPSYKANFIIWLAHHKSLTALSNMPLERQIPFLRTDDFVWSVFEESVPMSTYLVAFSVNDFGYKTSEQVEGSTVAFRTWYKKEALDQCDFAAEIYPKILKYYEDIFGVPFPLTKIDALVVPQFREGAMENWGLITHSEQSILFAPNVSSETAKISIAVVAAHELAHQWFGNLVTMKWWSDLWLNEGFSTYVASLGVHNLMPEWDSYNAESLKTMLAIFRSDVQLTSHPISQDIKKPSDIRQSFDAISYYKGSGVLRMLHMVLGDNGFFEGVRDYLEMYKYKNAEQNDLWAVFTEKALKYGRIESQYDIKTILDSWTLQTGYPLVKINRNYETGSVEITQQRYLGTVALPELEAQKCWWVPLSYTTASELDFMTTTPKAWLKCTEADQRVSLTLENVAKADEWLMFNMQLGGAYRITYDPTNWKLLTNTLNSENYTKIHVMNRAQLIDDAIWLAWSGHQGYDVTFDVLDYVIREHDFLPFQTAVSGFSSYFWLLKTFKDHTAYLKAYVGHIVAPMYKRMFGLNETVVNPTTSTHIQLLHKSLVYACACICEIDDCVHSAIDYFQQWKASENPSTDNPIPADLRPVVYCVNIRHGGKDDWQFLWQQYQASDVVTEKLTILLTLGCSRNPDILKSYIEMALDKEQYISKGDAQYPLLSLLNNEIGVAVGMDYLTTHITDLYEFFGPYSHHLSKFVSGLANSIVSAEELQKFTDFIQSHQEYFVNHQKTIESAFENASNVVKWMERSLDEIKTQLQAKLAVIGVETAAEGGGAIN